MRLALRAVCRPGDVGAIERPAYFGTLLLEDLGLKALEIPTDPHDGLLLAPLAEAIAGDPRHRPAAVLASPTVQNPLGASMPVERKRALVELLARTGAPLLEAAVSDVLASGDYERHLRRLKTRVQAGVRAVTARVQACFPPGTRVQAPRAGFLLWVQLPPTVDALQVHGRALELGIGVSPGPLFSPQGDLGSHLRLNCANEPTPRLLGAVEQIGQLCRELAQCRQLGGLEGGGLSGLDGLHRLSDRDSPA